MDSREELDTREVSKLSGLPPLPHPGVGRYAGFSLDEIGEMFSSNGNPAIDREQLFARTDDLEKSIRRLEAMRDGLRHAANCPEVNQLECPNFQNLIRKATKLQHKEDRKQKQR